MTVFFEDFSFFPRSPRSARAVSKNLSAHLHQCARLHLMDVRYGVVPGLRADADVAAKRILQFEEKNEGGDDDGGDHRRHQKMHARVAQTEQPAEADDANPAQKQNEPLEPRKPDSVD